MAAVLFTFISIFTFQNAFGTFDADEFKSITYDIDILSKPILSGETSSGFVIHLASKYGQEYQCSLPDKSLDDIKVTNIDQLKEDTKPPDISTVLKPLENQPCLIKIKDWWTYKFCYGKIIKQYHTEENKAVGPTIILGAYESEFDWKSDLKGDNLNRERRYHSQYYVNGTKCDVTGEMRRTEVRFVCEEGAADYISQVNEPESCQYVIVVNTNRLCFHPLLQPPQSTKPKFIKCNPVLSSENYQLYQQEQEDEKKKIEEIRKQWLAKQEKKLSQMKKEQESLKEPKLKEKPEEKIEESKDDEKKPSNYLNSEIREDEKILKKLDEVEELIEDSYKLLDSGEENNVAEVFRLFYEIVAYVNEMNEYMTKVMNPRLKKIEKSFNNEIEAAKDMRQSVWKTVEDITKVKEGKNNKHKSVEDLVKLKEMRSALQAREEHIKEEIHFYEQLLDRSNAITNRQGEIFKKMSFLRTKLSKMSEDKDDFRNPDNFIHVTLNYLKEKEANKDEDTEKQEEKDQSEGGNNGVSTLKTEMEMESSSEELKSVEKKDLELEADQLIAEAAKNAIDAIEQSLGLKVTVESVEHEVDDEENSIEHDGEENNFRLVDQSEIENAIHRILAGDGESMRHLQHLSNMERNYRFLWRNEKQKKRKEENIF